MSKYYRKKEFSLVAYKIKYEGVSKEGGILKVDIKKKSIKKVFWCDTILEVS